jgi:DNA-binding HxlR family transcriptional regulator
MIKKPISDPIGCNTDILALQDALEILGGKWRLLLVQYFISRAAENNTFNKVEKDIEGISAKVLSQELKILERNSIIMRKEYKAMPKTVQYSITEYGALLQPIISTLVQWGTTHRLKMFQHL